MLSGQPQAPSTTGSGRQLLASVFRTAYYVCALVVSCHCVIVVCEAFAAIKADRLNDGELQQLCVEGTAASSSKMRKACLEAAHEHASPFLLAVLMRAVVVVRDEVWYCVSAPFRMNIVQVLVSLVLCIPWLGNLLRCFGIASGTFKNADGSNGSHVVIVTPGTEHGMSHAGLRRRCSRQLPTLDEESNGFVKLSLTNTSDTY